MALTRANLLIGLIRLISKLSLPAAQRAGRAIGTLAGWLPTRSRRVTEVNLRLCFPELDQVQQRQLLRDSLRHTGQVAMEIPLIWEWPVARCLDLIKSIEGEELLEEARASGKGLLLLAPHLGNWELCGLYFSTRYRMAALYSPPSLPGFEDYMTAQRGRQGTEYVPGDRRGLARLIGMLREGEVAGILPDQSPKATGSAFAPFFGIEVRTMTLVSKLLLKSGATPLITWCQRLPDGCVRAAPEQYQWEYKRFRHRPPGQPNPYHKRY
jgi:Kdo2-lipid IVA lauroyltransferase/acyltransferase